MPREYPRGPSGGAVLRGREGLHPEADSAAHGPRGDASADVLARPHRRSPRRRPRTTGRTGPRPPSEPRLSSHLDVGRGGGGGISTPEPTSRRLRPLMTPPACISRSPPRRPRTAPAVFPTSCRPSQTSRRTARRAFRHPRPARRPVPCSVPTHQPRSSTANAGGDCRLSRAAAIGAAVGPGSGAGRGAGLVVSGRLHVQVCACACMPSLARALII